MKGEVLFIMVAISMSIVLHYNFKKYSTVDYLRSHKICPSTGEKTKYTSCIQGPHLNNGFIVSVSSIKNISEIQKSLNENDKFYSIEKNKNGYLLINNNNQQKQIIPTCEDMNKEEIMEKINTRDIYSSI